jgi:hypothetical protein
MDELTLTTIIPKEVIDKGEIVKSALKDMSLDITTDEQAKNANDFLRSIKSDYKFFEDKRKAIKEPVLQLGKEIDARFKQFTVPLVEAEEKLKGALTVYQVEQDRKRREAEAKAIAEAKRLEEQDRLRLESKAMKLEEKGRSEQAEALREQAEAVYRPVVLVQPEASKLEGSSFRSKTVAIIEDIKLIPQEYYLNTPGVVEAIQIAMNVYAKNKVPIPGVRYEERHFMAVRA